MSGNVSMHSMNKSTLKASIYKNLALFNSACKDALLEEANITMAESLSEVPKDTNTLASIGEVVIKANNPLKFEVQVGYGITKDAYNPKSRQFASQYMLKVHEDLFAKHTNGKAKFLEDPINRAKIRIAERMKIIGRSVWK